MNVVEEAYKFARKVYKDKTYNGKPFVSHPAQVARIIKTMLPIDYELQSAAYLHDVLEDTKVTPADLTELFGANISSLVYEVTKTGYNTFPNLKTRRGIILKFADRLSNLVNMESWDEEKQREYIEKSKFWKI